MQQKHLATLVRATGASGEGEPPRLDLEPVNRPDCLHDGRPRLLGGGTASRTDVLRTLPERLLRDGVDERPLRHVVMRNG